ncbi:hypothetical protein F4779DRAFT_618548 [Xylariaceae sp. FL0662B]|nr:hypothetical protein F4779DRAFT_618548 [Xylariaceae sp. FL0662B]
MYSSSIFYILLAALPVYSAPALDTREPNEAATVAKRETFQGFCSIDENACYWRSDTDERDGICTCSTGNEVNTK